MFRFVDDRYLVGNVTSPTGAGTELEEKASKAHDRLIENQIKNIEINGGKIVFMYDEKYVELGQEFVKTNIVYYMNK